MNIKIMMLWGLLLSIATAEAQSSFNAIEDVILLNNKPYLVRMALNGEILSFQKDLKDTYSAIANVKRKEIHIENLILPSEMIKAADTDIAMIEAEVPEDISEEVPTTANEVIVEKGPKKNFNYDYAFGFDHRSAALSHASVNQLNHIATAMLQNNETEAFITSYFSQTVDVSKILSKNRTNAIRDILLLRGIDSNRINIEQVNKDDWANNKVRIAMK